jgi:hypothetical protein
MIQQSLGDPLPERSSALLGGGPYVIDYEGYHVGLGLIKTRDNLRTRSRD